MCTVSHELLIGIVPATLRWTREDGHPDLLGAEPAGEIGGREMSCQRCGGLLAVELADAMGELVCGKFVIEGRHCHCNDVEAPVNVDLPGEGSAAFAGGSPEIISSEEGTR